DRNFSEADKDVLFDAQLQMVRSVIPKYRELAEKGQVELTTSPYYHPILPLICHVDSARTASPGIQLPHRHFSHREDAEQQIALGMATFERLLGRRPRGLWPSEMAVGESVAGLAVQAGLEWMISDEDVLARSLEGGLARDGEGHDFLNALYTELEASPDVVCTTVADFLEEKPARRPLHRLFTGSWINGSLDTWIGDPEHTVAWDLLAETRDWLDDYARNHPNK